ncbi:MAG TPA: hypothetical protein VME22_22455 [Solirubrobacteraceae bacterium]|nr:hypothetical protein [Solirubrobacteraceae bacterium]
MDRCPILRRATLAATRRSLLVLVCVALGALAAGCGGSSRRTGGYSVLRPARAPAVRAGSRSTPSVASIASGGFAGYALLTNGHVWAWGDDLEGQIGDGGAWDLSTTPVAIAGLSRIVAIAAGANTAYALQSGGVVWAWGDDALGQLGSAGPLPRATPGPVRHLSGVMGIAAGEGNGYALRRDGTVWAWGDPSLGQLGAEPCGAPGSAAGRCQPSSMPVQVQGLGGVTAIAAGADTVYALRRDGSVWAWGDDGFGALGTHTRRQFVDRPTRVRGLAHVVAIAAGSATAYALLSDGSVWAWGRGIDGELGDGEPANRSVPTRVLTRSPVVQVGGGGAMAYALDRQGRIWAWGSGLYGQLGNGYLVSLDEPTRVLTLP